MLLLKKKVLAFFIALLMCSSVAFSQKSFSIKDYVQLNAMASVGDNAPFWLVSNRNGTMSLDNNNGYIRYGFGLDGAIGNAGKWRYSLGLDFKVGYNQSYNPLLHQLYADISYKWLNLSVGAKERVAEMRDFCSLAGVNGNKVLSNAGSLALNGLMELGTGGLAYSNNSAPIPQLRLEVPE